MVRVPGFMVPLEDSANLVKEFLLVPYPQACIHVPAPPPNLIVYVKMESGKQIKPRGWDPIWVTGFLELKKSKSIYAEAAYELSGISAEDYKE